MFDHLNIRHIFGLVELRPSIDQVVVLCLVKNAEHHIESFIQHYQNAGYAHIAFLDNGSTDLTVQKARAYKNVSIFSSDASYKKSKHLMHFFLMRTFGSGSWFLMVDIDERFVYPYSEEIPLPEFVRYLNQNHYTGVVAQMLDMAPKITLKQLQTSHITSIESTDWFFNTTAITRHPYQVDSNILPNNKIEFWRGGIRKLLFEYDNLLTKHPLNLGDGKIITHGSHKTGNRIIADVTGLLLHYKFVGDFVSMVKTAVEHGQYFNNSMAYRQYLEVIEANPNMSLHHPSSIKYDGKIQLEGLGLFEYSDNYFEQTQ